VSFDLLYYDDPFIPCMFISASFAHRCPWLWINIHPAVPIIFAYLFVLAIASMLKTSWTDPGVRISVVQMQGDGLFNQTDHGSHFYFFHLILCRLQIIPRNLHPMSTAARDNNRYSVSYDDMWPQNLPLPKEVQVKDQIVRLKYCDTCQLYRPPRASHCRQCDNCVGMYDAIATVYYFF
jgi:palmitoyltransferase ZDHHC9/14/18